MAAELFGNFKWTSFCWLLFVSSFAIAIANPKISVFDDNENQVEYQYRYAVDESNSKGPVMDRWEQRIGEYVKGAYSVVEPDGRVRTVDYEVDGKKGYHATIRMNDPGPNLLSYQQLQKSFELYPEPLLPPRVEDLSRSLLPPNPTEEKTWNHHSDIRNVNNHAGSGQKLDSHVKSSFKASIAPRSPNNLPLSPVNFNTPQTTNTIYYETPVTSIFHQSFQPDKPENFILRHINEKAFLSVFEHGPTDIKSRRRRHSKVVKTINSLSGVIS